MILVSVVRPVRVSKRFDLMTVPTNPSLWTMYSGQIVLISSIKKIYYVSLVMSQFFLLLNEEDHYEW